MPTIFDIFFSKEKEHVHVNELNYYCDNVVAVLLIATQFVFIFYVSIFLKKQCYKRLDRRAILSTLVLKQPILF